MKIFILIVAFFCLSAPRAVHAAPTRDHAPLKDHMVDRTGPVVSHAFVIASNSPEDQESPENLALRKEILQFAQETFNSLAETTGFIQYTTEAAKKFKLEDVLIGIPSNVKNADQLATYTVVDPDKKRLTCWNPKFWRLETHLQKRQNVINAFSADLYQKMVLSWYADDSNLKGLPPRPATGATNSVGLNQ